MKEALRRRATLGEVSDVLREVVRGLPTVPLTSPARYPRAMATKFVIIGGGPAGNTAATHAARLGADVTLIERDIVGGAAHLWDCIPSKTMIATGGAVAFAHRMVGMGLERFDPHLDLDAQRAADRQDRDPPPRPRPSSC